MKHIKLFEEFNRETLSYEKFSKLYDLQLDNRAEKRLFDNMSEFLGGNIYALTDKLREAIYDLTDAIDKSEAKDKIYGRFKEIITYESDAGDNIFGYHLIKYKVNIGGQIKHIICIDESEVEQFNEDPYIFFANADDVDYMKEKLEGYVHGKNYGI
jgi:hypothetical protein